MALRELLVQREDTVWRRWYERILSTYPDRTAAFLEGEKDQFANPVGSTIARGTRRIVEVLLAGGNPEDLRPEIEPIVKIRALQDFSPSAAVSFVIQLRDVFREEVANGSSDSRLHEELRALEAKVERLMLLAFDVYVGCRERLHEVRVNELRRSVSGLLRRVTDPELRGGGET